LISGCSTIPHSKAQQSQTLKGSPLRESLPPAPKGFSWEVFDDIHCGLLKPNGWFTGISKTENGYTGSISVEDYNAVGSFETGVTIQYVKNIKKAPPSVIATNIANVLLSDKTNESIAIQPMESMGDSKKFIIQYKIKNTIKPEKIVHQIFIAFDKKDILIVVTFEANVNIFDEYWKQFAKTIFSQILMLPPE
jgi:hypothetical protein